eukprot:TRINITY_DN25783_c0_g1_i4.p1 TRINITY_DN25783_c0_g1~~TRINITY_DN25783_c0_g1_i4.p1  ORF type:complete len:154 (-),score=4.08 TRINITY_DN25783_c0_g1_i4:48-509(-)
MPRRSSQTCSFGSYSLALLLAAFIILRFQLRDNGLLGTTTAVRSEVSPPGSQGPRATSTHAHLREATLPDTATATVEASSSRQTVAAVPVATFPAENFERQSSEQPPLQLPIPYNHRDWNATEAFVKRRLDQDTSLLSSAEGFAFFVYLEPVC